MEVEVEAEEVETEEGDKEGEEDEEGISAYSWCLLRGGKKESRDG